MTILAMLLSFILGGIFLASALPKLRSPRGFIFTVLEYRVLPLSLGKLYGWLLPPLELFLAFLLFSGAAVGLASGILSLLLFSFLIAISLNITRGRDLDCGCFGMKKQHKIGWKLLLQDMLLLVVALSLPFLGTTWDGLTSWSVFHLFGLTNSQSLIPLFICFALSVCSAALFRRSMYERRGDLVQ